MTRHRRVTVQTETSSIFAILEPSTGVSAGITGTDPASGPQFDFSLVFKKYKPSALPDAPVTLKAMFTGKVVVRDFTYYVQLLPCVTEFAQEPAFEPPLLER